jgi:hypothetical protein
VAGRFRSDDQHSTGLRGPSSSQRAQATAQTAAGTRANLVRPRHSGLFQAIHRLDQQIDEAGRRELTAWISDQYTRDYGDIPLGFLARCYLGPPYIDHRLDLLQSIAEHFTPDSVVPAPFDRARSLVRSSSYEFVEVYASGTLVAVRADGSVDSSPGGM